MIKAILLFLLSFAGLASQAQKRELNDMKFSLEVLRLAMLSGDKAQLLQVTTPELSYGHSSGLVETQEQFIEKLSSGKSDFVSINISSQTIALYKNAAVVRHELNAETNDNGKAGTVKLQVVQFWVETKMGWQLASRQAIKIQ
ncbi:MAG: nuclear transport factor 2 family protein [Rhizobacter sp.]|nr:nuclear transport factor 2 family protein [Ferruginibacter sp.]